MRISPQFALLAGLMAATTLLADPPRDSGPKPEGGRDRGDHDRRGSVTFYEHADFGGASFTLAPGEDLVDLSRVRFSNGTPANDRVSSIRIEGNLTVIVYRDARFRGGELRLTHDVHNFAERERDWNDTISSIRVERDGRPPVPPPSRPDREDLRYDKLIERAYLDILQRPVDPAGLRSYRIHLIEDHWNEQQLRDALRRTDEFRQVAERIVAKAYRDLLGRNPDEGGGRMFRDRILRDRWTEEDVRNAIRKSPEYRDRQRHNGGG